MPPSHAGPFHPNASPCPGPGLPDFEGGSPSLLELRVVVADGCVLIETGGQQAFPGTGGPGGHQIFQVLIAITGWEGCPLVFQLQGEGETSVEASRFWHHRWVLVPVRRGWQMAWGHFRVGVLPAFLPGVSRGPDCGSSRVH